MQRRQRQAEVQENQDRWMVSYADFITLLFAFFVVMYAISSVNEGKYRVLSESMTKAFSVSAKSMEPIQIGELARSGSPQSVEFIKRPAVADRSNIPVPVAKTSKGELKDAGDKPLQILFDGLRTAVAEISDKGLIEVNSNDDGVEIEISSSILFDSGEAILSDKARPTMTKLAQVLMPFPHDVNVQGYTDDRPIKSPLYPSNWELSAARAASVVQLFVALGMAPERLSATGFGEFRPVDDNDYEEGRSANRRVVIFVPVLKDKARVMDAINRLGARLNRGITFEQPASPEPSEGLRQSSEVAPGQIIDSPAGESRFFNASPTELNKRAVERERASEASPSLTENVTDKPDGERHIAREPIEGVRNSVNPAGANQ